MTIVREPNTTRGWKILTEELTTARKKCVFFRPGCPEEDPSGREYPSPARKSGDHG